MTRRRKFLKIFTNAYHSSERDIYKLLRRIKCTNINENASSQSLDTTDFYHEDFESLLFGTNIVSIKTCDQDECPIVLSTTDSGVLTCSCSEEKYTYLYQLLLDKDGNPIDICRTDLCDDKDANMASSHQDVISLKKYRDLRENEILVCKQTIERLRQAHNHALQDAASVKQTERHLLLDNIFTQTTLLLHQEEQTEIKSSLGNIFTQNTTHLLHQEEQTEIKSSLGNICTQMTTHLLHKDEQTEIKSSLGNIFTQNTTHLLHQEEQTEIKSLLHCILKVIKEVRKLSTDQKGQAKGETVNGYETDKILSLLHVLGEGTTSSMFPEIIKEHPSIQLHLPTKVQSSEWKLRKATAKIPQDLMMLDYLLTLKSSNYGKFDIESYILSLTVKQLNDLKDKMFLDSFSSSSKSFLKMLYKSLQSWQKDFYGFDFLNGKSLADKNNEQKESKNLAEKKSKEDNEKANMKNLTDLHSTLGDTDDKTDEASQDIDLKDKTKDEKEGTTKSENQEHREHGEGMSLFKKLRRGNNNERVDVCLDKKGNEKTYDAASMGRKHDKTEHHTMNMKSRNERCHNDAQIPVDSDHITGIRARRDNELEDRRYIQTNTITHTDIDHIVAEGSVSTSSLNLLESDYTHGDIRDGNRPRKISLNYTLDNNSNLSDHVLGSAKHPQFIGIHNRLKSFIGWSHRHLKEPRYFVEAGFYYTGKEDIVRCFFCDIGLAEWISDDDPWVEHARHSPSCLFVTEKRGREFVENIQRKWRQIYCPKHTEFEELSARIRSFSNWPSHIIQRPEKLASAGFYYTGKNDEVRCHYCTGELKGWEEDDEPWTEHARWFPSCKFLIKSKGSAYVEEIARKYISNHVTDGSSRTRGQDDQSRTEPRNNTQLPIDGIGSEAAKLVQQIEYSREKVNRAIDELIRTCIETLQLATTKVKADIFVCKYCENAERCMIFVPCGHRLVCEPCSKKIKRCLHCNKSIKKCIKSYLS